MIYQLIPLLLSAMAWGLEPTLEPAPIPAPALSAQRECNALYHRFAAGGRSSLEFEISRNINGQMRSTLGTAQITPENFAHLFAEEYSPGLFGAKGIGYFDSRGNLHNLFWKTGEGRGNPTQIHHRDALADLLEKESQRIEDAPRSRLPGQRSEAEAWVNFQESSAGISSERKTNTIPAEVLRRSQGYQLTAQDFRGKRQITYVDIDSGITSAQLSQGLKPNPRMTALFIQKILESIEPSLRSVRQIRVRDWPPAKLEELRQQLRILGFDQFPVVPLK